MRRERGSALLIGLFVVSVGTLIAVAVLELAGSAYARTRRANEAQQLNNILEAAVESTRYELVATRDLTLSLNETFAGGQYWVTTNPMASLIGAVDVMVTAEYKGRYVTVTRKIGAGFHIPRPFDYAFASAQYDWDDQYNIMGSLGANGDVRANGYLQWNKGGLINGTLTTQGLVYDKDGDVYGSARWDNELIVTGTVTMEAQPLTFPSIDWAYYLSIANTYYPSGVSGNNIVFPSSNWVTYINGNLNIGNGKIYGRGIVVVDGTITFKWGSLRYDTGADGPCVFIARNVGFDALVGRVDSYIYCPGGRVTTDGALTVFGGIACLELVTKNNLTVLLDPTLRGSADLGWEMHLPGY